MLAAGTFDVDDLAGLHRLGPFIMAALVGETLIPPHVGCVLRQAADRLLRAGRSGKSSQPRLRSIAFRGR